MPNPSLRVAQRRSDGGFVGRRDDPWIASLALAMTNMNELRCKVLIIGGGPGGYVAAIRAGQLGLDTVLVEADRVGGTCLNVGCIPSKALIHAAGLAHALTDPHGLNAIGLAVASPALDYARTVAWKDAIVSRLTTGVAALLKRARVRTLHGPATFSTAKRPSPTPTPAIRASPASISSSPPVRKRWRFLRCRSAATCCRRPRRWR